MTESGRVRTSRRAFIESQGATCANWNWSWSFVNTERRQVIFGAWTHHSDEDTCLILDDAWEVRRERKQPGYSQAREHIRLIEDERYELLTFPIYIADLPEGSDEGPAQIRDFTPVLTSRRLVRIGARWFGAVAGASVQSSEELPEQPGGYAEGAARKVTVNSYERSGEAREACLRHYGYRCRACGFDFERAYGEIGKEFIHVHHIVPIATIRAAYRIDHIRDLIPVCPNCHALIHRTRPALSIDELRAIIATRGPVTWPSPDQEPSGSTSRAGA
jgi:5-methylcytosine-specific restriction protein A